MAGELTMCTLWGQYQVSWPCYEDAIRWVDCATVWGCYQVNWSRYDAANRWIDRAMRPLSDKLTTLWWYDEGGSVWLLCTVEYCILFIAWEYWTKVRRRELSSPPLTGRNTRRRKEVGRRRRRRRSSAIICKFLCVPKYRVRGNLSPSLCKTGLWVCKTWACHLANYREFWSLSPFPSAFFWWCEFVGGKMGSKNWDWSGGVLENISSLFKFFLITFLG